MVLLLSAKDELWKAITEYYKKQKLCLKLVQVHPEIHELNLSFVMVSVRRETNKTCKLPATYNTSSFQTAVFLFCRKLNRTSLHTLFTTESVTTPINRKTPSNRITTPAVTHTQPKSLLVRFVALKRLSRCSCCGCLIKNLYNER